MIFETRTFDVTFDEGDAFVCSMDAEETFNVEFGGNSAREYHGVYNVTPSEETQTLLTANRVLTQNVVIDPIPSNYGLITWNGSFLTVS